MTKQKCTVITGTGRYIPSVRVPNSAFLSTDFYGSDGEFEKYSEKSPNAGQRKPSREIVETLADITGISERRYVTEDLVTSDIAFLSSKDCLESSGTDKEELGAIIVAHNFGDVKSDNRKSDFVPSLASRVKSKLEIKNPWAFAHDTPFGCPGWLHGLVQAHYYIQGGAADIVLVTGAETLSRVSDPHDHDSMIYADGAGTVEVRSVMSDELIGILSQATRSDASNLLRMGRSYNPNYNGDQLFLKMDGHDLFEYAWKEVSGVVRESLDRAKVKIGDVKKILIHQANDKLDYKIVRRLLRSYEEPGTDEQIRELMPMTISWLGNSSVATLPTLFDLILKEKLENPNSDNNYFPLPFEGSPLVPGVISEAIARGGPFPSLDSPRGIGIPRENSAVRLEDRVEVTNNNHKLKEGDVVVFASVGAGMNINSVVYRMSGLEFKNLA